MPDTKVDTIVRGGQVVTSSQVYSAAIELFLERRSSLWDPRSCCRLPTTTLTPRGS